MIVPGQPAALFPDVGPSVQYIKNRESSIFRTQLLNGLDAGATSADHDAWKAQMDALQGALTDLQTQYQNTSQADYIAALDAYHAKIDADHEALDKNSAAFDAGKIDSATFQKNRDAITKQISFDAGPDSPQSIAVNTKLQTKLGLLSQISDVQNQMQALARKEPQLYAAPVPSTAEGITTLTNTNQAWIKDTYDHRLNQVTTVAKMIAPLYQWTNDQVKQYVKQVVGDAPPKAATVAQLPLTIDIANALMVQAMTTGIASAAFEPYGGFEAVQTYFLANGGQLSKAYADKYNADQAAKQAQHLVDVTAQAAAAEAAAKVSNDALTAAAAAAANKQVKVVIDNMKKDTGVKVTTSGGNFGTLALIAGAAFLLGKL